MNGIHLTMFLLISLWLTVAWAQDGAVTDKTLLEDLGAELLGPANEKPRSVLDERLLEELGEDLGQDRPAQEDSLAKAIKHMQAAQSLLERGNKPSGASTAQADALVNLDSLIAELTERKSKCCGGSCKPGKPSDKKPKSSKPKSSKKAGKSPAKSAPTSTNSDADLSTELAAAGELVKDLWGQLPERQREQILQPLSEEFLPKYAAEIEAYFRDLADRRSAESP